MQMRSVSLELEILGRHQHPELTISFLKVIFCTILSFLLLYRESIYLAFWFLFYQELLQL